MGDVVNLNRFRKAKRKAEAEDKAAANRVRHGRTKAERARDQGDRQRAAADLDGKRIED